MFPFQRQSCEIERLKMDKENLEHQLENATSLDSSKSHAVEEYVSLQARLKVWLSHLFDKIKNDVCDFRYTKNKFELNKWLASFVS